MTEAVQKYEQLYPFKNGLAKVAKDGKYGYIDYKGNEVIPCQYDGLTNFYGSIAVVKSGKLYGCLNHKGEEIIPCEYEFISNFSDGLAQVKKNNLYGLIDEKGKEIVPCEYETIANFSDGLVRVKKDGLYGFVDRNGKEVIPCKYEYAESFSEGLAVCKKEGQYGFIDKSGKEVISCKYNFARSFSNGLAAIEMNDANGLPSGGYIDTKGNIVIPCSYNTADGMNPFSNEIAVVMDENGLLGCINTEGKVIINFDYDHLEIFDDVVIARETGGQLYGLFDNKGKAITPFIYDAIYPSKNNLIIVVKDRKSGFINKDGKEAIPCMFDAYFNEDSGEGWIAGCTHFNEGISIVKSYGKYGAIDEKGNELVPQIYDSLEEYSEGLFVADISGKYGYVDSNGNSTFSQEEMEAANIAKAKIIEEERIKEEKRQKLEALKQNPGLFFKELLKENNYVWHHYYATTGMGYQEWEHIIIFYPNNEDAGRVTYVDYLGKDRRRYSQNGLWDKRTYYINGDMLTIDIREVRVYSKGGNRQDIYRIEVDGDNIKLVNLKNNWTYTATEKTPNIDPS